VLALITAVTSLLVVVTSGTLYAVYLHYGSRIESIPGLDILKESRGGGSRGVNYLIVGSDSGDGLTDAQLREVGANRVGRAGTRTDTIILVHLPPGGRQARFISIPRDSYVAIPGHGHNKINSAFGYGEHERKGGGPATLLATVQQATGLRIDHYVQVSLLGFYTITNAVGGVDVCLIHPVKEWHANIDLPAGRQTLHGKDALAFVRQRYGLPGGDLGRIRRQQYFLGHLTHKVLSAGVLLNPFRLNSLLNAAGNSVQVDPGTSRRDLIDLALKLRSVSAGKVAFETIPVADPAGRRDLPGQANASVVLLDDAALPGFFASLDAARPSSAASLTVAPPAIAVEVDNGTTRAGLARRVGTALAGVGFRIRQVRTAARTDVATTTVRYGAARADSARTVAAALPGSRSAADASLPPSGLVVTVGSSYRGVRKVIVAARGASATHSTTAADRGCIA
jgi:LCP family protein required for cell wall assembly